MGVREKMAFEVKENTTSDVRRNISVPTVKHQEEPVSQEVRTSREVEDEGKYKSSANVFIPQLLL